MTSADKWLKQELDELEKAQKMINDAISTFDDPTPYIESQANGNLKKKSNNVSNSQSLSEADRSVAELLSSLNIEEESPPRQEKLKLPDPPSLDDLLIEEKIENTPSTSDLPKKGMSKPVKKTTGFSSVTIQLKGPSDSNNSSVNEPSKVEIPPPIPPLPAEDKTDSDEHVVCEPPKPFNQLEETQDITTKNTQSNSSVGSSVSSMNESAADSEVSKKLPKLTLENQMNDDQKKELSDLEKDLEFYTKTLLGNIDTPKVYLIAFMKIILRIQEKLFFYYYSTI